MRHHLGCEIEFFASERTAQPAIPEYYPNQWEVNDFHVVNDTPAQNWRELFRWADQVKERSARGLMNFGGSVHGSSGPVFSGVHLHLQVRGNRRRDQGSSTAMKQQFANRLSEIVMTDVLRYYGLSFRFMVSHHLHGAYRESRHEHKRRPGFTPVKYHRDFDTYEIRCIEPDMLYTEEGRAALKSILKRAYAYLSGSDVRLPVEYSNIARSMMQLPGDLRTVEDRNGYMRFLRDCRNTPVNIRFAMRYDHRNARLNVVYKNVFAEHNQIRVVDYSYQTHLQDRQRLDIASLTSNVIHYGNILRKRREDNRPIEPRRLQDEPLRHFEIRYSQYRSALETWEIGRLGVQNTTPFDINSLEFSAELNSQRSLNVRDLFPGAVVRMWNAEHTRVGYGVVCNDGITIRYSHSIPRSIPASGLPIDESRLTRWMVGHVDDLIRDRDTFEANERRYVTAIRELREAERNNTRPEVRPAPSRGWIRSGRVTLRSGASEGSVGQLEAYHRAFDGAAAMPPPTPIVEDEMSNEEDDDDI